MVEGVNSGSETRRYFLVDNGSLRPESTLRLRAIARALSERVGKHFEAVSLLHSHKVSADALEGEAARILFPTIKQYFKNGCSDFFVLPLFFGPSRAMTEYVPEQVMALQKTHPELRVEVGPCLVDVEDSSDDAMAALLKKHVDAVIKTQALEQPKLVLVDHGTPAPAVNAVRNFLGEQLRVMTSEQVSAFSVASMERREGAEYDFNEPLLEKVLARPTFSSGDVVVSMLFLNPGRHAGPGGDIAQICEEARANHPDLRIHMTALVGEAEELVEILAARFARSQEASK